MLYYFNSFILYSTIGFWFESFIFKFTNVCKHSGIFYGPITGVYGVGAVFLILIYKYVFKKLKVNKYVKPIIMYVICVVFLSLIEFTLGNILNMLFDIDMWNYSSHKIHFGKYVCLVNSLVWGLFGVLFIYYIKDFFDRFLGKVSKKSSYILLSIFIIDSVFVLLTR